MTAVVDSVPGIAAAAAPAGQVAKAEAATFLVFSGEMDKLLMAFTLANAAAASGMRTTMFFTFWSLSALRTRRRARGKNLVERMFGWMLPASSRALPMSRLQMGGIGPRMIRWRMGRKGVASLEQQIESAMALGVRFVVCETSMDLMGFRQEELVAGVTLGGAATCLEAAAGSRVAMVI